MMIETQRRRRGHAFMPPKAVMAKIPRLYGSEDVPTADKIVYVHYFTASGDWYLTELDPDTGEAFGYVDLHAGFPEWGYFDLGELEQLSLYRGLIIVERDIHWEPVKFREAINA